MEELTNLIYVMVTTEKAERKENGAEIKLNKTWTSNSNNFDEPLFITHGISCVVCGPTSHNYNCQLANAIPNSIVLPILYIHNFIHFSFSIIQIIHL